MFIIHLVNKSNHEILNLLPIRSRFSSCSSDSDLERAVVEVIDHHLVERASSPSCPITVETVGSCATLVTEKIFQKAPDVLDQQVAQLLYGKTQLIQCAQHSN